MRPKRILFLVPYPLRESPSQRFRFEQYFTLLDESGFQFETQSFLDSFDYQLFFKSGRPLRKLLALSGGIFKRWVAILRAHRFEFIFIHREVAPIGPPIFEWLLARVFKKKIIYDFDDAIWLTDRSNESSFRRFIKWRQKVRTIIRLSYKVSCGNCYLSTFARQHNNNIVVNPTTVDTVGLHNPALYPNLDDKKENIVIGWTGSHSTLKYLEESKAILEQVERRFSNVEFVVIADRKPSMRLERLKFVPWNSDSEIRDLMRLDIGIMPLPDDQWSKGKCGFKALQYMALEIPAVASAVGVNNKIIDSGQNGFLCSTPDEWLSALTSLIEDQILRKKMGAMAREKVIDSYSVSSNSALFLRLFE